MTDQPVKPNLAMPVANMTASIVFYIDCLGFTLADQQPATDAAHMIDSDGDPLLLVGPQAEDVTPYLAESHFFTRPGQTINFLGDDLDVRRVALLQKGLTDVQLVEKRWGDRSLIVKDPDGYTLQFIAQRSQVGGVWRERPFSWAPARRVSLAELRRKKFHHLIIKFTQIEHGILLWKIQPLAKKT